MNVSFPLVLGSTLKPEPRISAKTINSPASTESQGSPTDHSETSSQCSSIAKSDRSDISLQSGRSDTSSRSIESDLFETGEDFWEPRATQCSLLSDCSELSSPLNLSDTEDHFLDHVSIQREAWNSGIVDAFSKTRQPASQPENPFKHTTVALPPRPLPTPPKQQEITDSNGQHSLNESPRLRIRLSRPDQSQEVPSSEQTGAKRESRDKKIMKSARQSLCKEKSIKNMAEITDSNGQHSLNERSRLRIRIRLSRPEQSQEVPSSEQTDAKRESRDKKIMKSARQSLCKEKSIINKAEITDSNGQHSLNERKRKRPSRHEQSQEVSSFERTDDDCEPADQMTRRRTTRKSIINKAEITDSNGQHPSYKRIRLSRLELYQGVPSSQRTDDECESSDPEIRKRARMKLCKRKFIKNKAEITDSNGQPPSYKRFKRIRLSRHKQYQGVPSSEQTDDDYDSTNKEVRKKAKEKLSRRRAIKNKAEITDSNGQQSLERVKRLSRHEPYQEVPSSEQTDDERESSDPEIRERARQRLSKRKQALKKKCKKLN